MRRIVLYMLIAGAVFAQEKSQKQFSQKENSLAVSAGMGVAVINIQDLTEYINLRAAANERINDWNTGVEFFGDCEFPITDEWGAKIEYAYLFKTFTFVALSSSTNDLFFALHSPTFFVQRIISGTGYFLKFGAGIGPRFAGLVQTVSTFGTSSSYFNSGLGIEGEIAGQTAFDENFFGYISGRAGAEFLGSVGSSGTIRDISNLQSRVNLRTYSAGIRFGFIYYF